jgi:hypothetical protein
MFLIYEPKDPSQIIVPTFHRRDMQNPGQAISKLVEHPA